MLERVRGLPATPLDPEPYSKSYHADWNRIRDGFWKLERIQSFREPDHPSWPVWLAGDWAGVLEIFEAERPELEEFFSEFDFDFRRVRVVEFPLSPYLQWELNILKVRAESGEQLRILTADKLAGLETDGILPEVVVLGTESAYEILYDGTGTHSGARRFIQPEVIAACRDEIQALFDQAEDFFPFFEREVAPLPVLQPDNP